MQNALGSSIKQIHTTKLEETVILTVDTSILSTREDILIIRQRDFN